MKFYKLFFLAFMFVLAYHHARIIYVIFFSSAPKKSVSKPEVITAEIKENSSIDQDAIKALRKLGYKQKSIVLAIEQVNAPGKSTEVLIRDTLNILATIN